MPRSTRSISLPIVLASIAVGTSIALLIGWTLLVVLTPGVSEHLFWLIGGIASLAVVMAVLVLFSIFLVREILEVRRQNRFIDSVTHELKSPLSSLKLCLQTLGRPEVTPAQREDLRQMMIDDVERLSVFIDGVLEASRLAQPAQGHELSEVDLGALLHHCAEAVARRYRTREDAIEVEVAEDLRILSDPTALEVVVKNLIDNAVKYSDEPIRVRVQARRHDPKTAVLEVHDQGIGIPREHLKRIFGRFYRVPGEAVRARRGTGLGLFVVSGLVRHLGGRLDACSGGAGQGTCMRVFLPLEAQKKGRAA